jgi:hypothetical protein
LTLVLMTSDALYRFNNAQHRRGGVRTRPYTGLFQHRQHG